MKDYNSLVIGAQIKKYRTLRGFSQQKLANLVGVSASYIGEIEHGGFSENSSISMKNIVNISNALNVSLDDLASENIEYHKYRTDNSKISSMIKEMYSMSLSQLNLFFNIISIFISNK